jgi:hypothetical protein
MGVAEYGTQNWAKIALLLHNRDSRQCKERWTHFLAPEILKSEWTKEEDSLLEEKIREYGNKWKLLQSFFPGRSETNIKNRYRLILRHKNKEIRIRRPSRKKEKQSELTDEKKKEDIWNEPFCDEEVWDSESFDRMWMFP